MPLHSSLGNNSETPSQNKKKNTYASVILKTNYIGISRMGLGYQSGSKNTPGDFQVQPARVENHQLPRFILKHSHVKRVAIPLVVLQRMLRNREAK